MENQQSSSSPEKLTISQWLLQSCFQSSEKTASSGKKSHRSTINDGLENVVLFYSLTHFKPLWVLLQSNSQLRRWINKYLLNRATYVAPVRPYQHTTFSNYEADDYTSWDALTDRSFSGRHLPRSSMVERLQYSSQEIAEQLFPRKPREFRESETSTVLFSYFVQWFADGFLITDPQVPEVWKGLKNKSNHNVDLSPLYGLNKQTTDILRSHHCGKLKSQMIPNELGIEEEYPPYYYGTDGQPKEEFQTLAIRTDGVPPEKRLKLFAMGKDNGNAQIGFVMMNTLFLRAHNRICDELIAEHPGWDDERIFQTSRNILIVVLLKIIIEEYINHITPYHFQFFLDPKSFYQERWQRPNWMAIEFNLLYRWHSLVPDQVFIGKSSQVPIEQTRWETEILTQRGLGQLLDAASSQPAGKIGLFNTPNFLLPVDQVSIELGRKAQLASYNDYRELCQLPRATDFNQITGCQQTQECLKALYGQVDNLELYVGLFAEDPRPGSPIPPLMARLIAIDAFSQVLTNPLLAETIFKEETFSRKGWEIIQNTKSLSDILHKLLRSDQQFKVSMNLDTPV